MMSFLDTLWRLIAAALLFTLIVGGFPLLVGYDLAMREYQDRDRALQEVGIFAAGLFLVACGMGACTFICEWQKEKRCKYCSGKKISVEIPYCKECIENALRETQKLTNEAETRIKLANEMGLAGQAEGAKRWFVENLPEPIKKILERAREQAILSSLKGYFPQIKSFVFDSRRFRKYSLDSGSQEANIPSEALQMLAQFRNDLVTKKLLKEEVANG